MSAAGTDTGGAAAGADAADADTAGADTGRADAAGGGHCAAHPAVAAELRGLALTALDRLEPLLRRRRAEPADPPTPPSCAGCPVCALLGVLRGERPELAVTLAEQLAGVLAVLRTALEEGDPAATRSQPDDPAPADPPAPPGRRVQHIPVTRC